MGRFYNEGVCIEKHRLIDVKLNEVKDDMKEVKQKLSKLIGIASLILITVFGVLLEALLR